MATITSISPNTENEIQHSSTNGNQITFTLTSNISFDAGEACIKSSHSEELNQNFPTDIPELHFNIIEDASGSNSINISEQITVTMDNIYEEVAIKLVVKEGGTIKQSQTYYELPGTTGRG